MIEIWISNQEVWWNRGVEVKPSREAFRKFTFEKVNNFNISWIDELHINVIVPNGKKATLIKIIDNNDDDNITTKYYYLMEVLNKTSKNKECIYQLDVWLTYILNDSIGPLRSIKTLDGNQVNDNIEIDSFGVPTGKIESKVIDFEWTVPQAPEWYQKLYGKETYKLRKRAVDPEINDEKAFGGYIGGENNMYFVFTSQENRYHTSGQLNSEITNYILIPILNISHKGFYSYIPSLEMKTYDGLPLVLGNTIKSIKKEFLNRYNQISPLIYINSFSNLMFFIENYKQLYQSSGVGDFLGVWIGPSFWRIKDWGNCTSSGIGTQFNSDIWRAFPNIFSIFLDTAQFSQDRGMKFSYIGQVIDEMNDLNNQKLFKGDNVIGQTEVHLDNNYDPIMKPEALVGFMCLKVSNSFFKLHNLNFSLNDILRNYKYLGQSSLIRKMNLLTFNRKFTLTNGKDILDVNNQFPVSFDNYQNMLAQQEASMNTSLRIAGANAIFSAIGGAFGIVPPPPTETITTTEFNTKNTTGPQSINTFREKHVQGAIKDKTITRQWGVDVSGRRNILLKSNFSYLREPKEVLNLQTNTQRGAVDRLSSGTRTTTRQGNKTIGVGGILGGVMGLANAGLQFASTLAQQEAYKRDLRLATSNTITNYTDEYVIYTSNIKFRKPEVDISKITDINDERIKDYINKEIIYGATTTPGNLPKFYGFTNISKYLDEDIYKDNEEYILIDELTKLNLELTLTNKYSPTIKEAIITLLTNGIRVMNDLILFKDLGVDDETS